MIEHIKSLKSKFLIEIIENYDRILTQINQLSNELDELRVKENESILELVPYKRFNWFEKHIFKRKEYKKWNDDYTKSEKAHEQKNAEIEAKEDAVRKKIDELREQRKQSKEKVEKAKEELERTEKAETLTELGVDFKQAIEILQNEGIPIVLTEADKIIPENDLKYSSIDDFILVHKTRFYPTDSKIKTSLSKSIEKPMEEQIGSKIIKIPYRSYRDTIHFSVNGEVGDHMYGSWNDCEYAVLIPMRSCKLDQIGSAPPQDTFFNGDVELPEDSWILCPNGKKDEIQKANPNVHIMEYEGENVTDYADALVSLLGYRVEDVGMHGWQNSKSHIQYLDVMEKEGFSNFMPHMSCKEYLEESSKGAIGNFIIEIQAIQEKFSKEEFADNKVYIFYRLQASVRSILSNYILDNGEYPSLEEITELLKNELKNMRIELPEEVLSIALEVGGKEHNNTEDLAFMEKIDILDSIAQKEVGKPSDFIFENDLNKYCLAPIITDAVLKGMERCKERNVDVFENNPSISDDERE